MTDETTPAPQASKGVWFFPYKEFTLAGGEIMIKPLKPVLVMTAQETAKFCQVSTKTLARLAESGFIRRREPTPRCPQYYPGEVMAFIEETERNPDYWTDERRRQYGLARRTVK